MSLRMNPRRFYGTAGWGNATVPTVPQASWQKIDNGVQSIHYEAGPVPFALVREYGKGIDSAQRDAGVDGVPIWVGETLELDGDREYEVKAPLNAYGVTDVMMSQSTAGGATGPIARQLSFLLDVPLATKKPGWFGLDFTCVVDFNATNNEVLNMPWRRTVAGVVYLEATGTSGGTNVTPSLRLDPRGDVSAQVLSATGGAMTADGQLRNFALGDIGRFAATTAAVNLLGGVSNASPGGGPFDRLSLFLDGTAGASGGMTIRVSIYGIVELVGS